MAQLQSFGDVLMPNEADEPILPRAVRSALMEWLTEIFEEKQLAALNIGARKKAIFDGPPGVGKTTLAHHMSARIGLPMLAVRSERLFSKYVGETSRLIGEMFDAAAVGVTIRGQKDPSPVVIFMDEFDALSRQRRRGDSGADDSRNEEVDTLLQNMDRYRGFMIAATNFGETVDQAIWRRFDIHIQLEVPGPLEIPRILARYLKPLGVPAAEMKLLAESFATASPALMRQFCENLKRQTVVGPILKFDMGKTATIDRLIASVKPHPSLGKPRLWAMGAKDPAIKGLTWPLARIGDPALDAPVPVVSDAGDDASHVVPFKGEGGTMSPRRELDLVKHNETFGAHGAFLLSVDGDGDHAQWIPKSLCSELYDGRYAIEGWKARQVGFLAPAGATQMRLI